jgi:hypothetical protein
MGHSSGDSLNLVTPAGNSSLQTKSTARNVAVKALISPFSLCSDSMPVQEHEGQSVDKETLLEVCCTLSIWSHEESQYFTLAFSSIASDRPCPDLHPKTGTKEQADSKSKSLAVPCSSDKSQTSIQKVSAAVHQTQSLSPSPRPDIEIDFSSRISTQQKALRLKDAILNSMNMPAYG